MPTNAPTSQSRRRATVALALVLLAALLAGACGDGDRDASPSGPATAGLLVLAGEPGAAALRAHDAAGTARDVPLPAPSTAWISAARRGEVVATLGDGTLRLAPELRADRPPAWANVPGEDVELPADPLYFATWSPNGRRIAAIASDYAAEGRLTLAIIDPVGDASLLLPVPRRPLVAAPVWLDDERLLVQTNIGFAIVDTGTGDVGLGPQGDLAAGVGVAAAADGSLVAIAATAGGSIEIRARDRWLAGDQAVDARLEGEGEIGSIAFDRRAERLAVVWQQPDGPGTLVVYRRADGWREAHRSTLPGESARAVVDFLP